MAAFSIKTKDQSKAREKPRVYFTCHPEDISGPVEKLCKVKKLPLVRQLSGVCQSI